jgi:putative aldouronate transport system permease protein
VVTTTSAPDITAVRTVPVTVKDSVGYKVFRAVNAVVLALVCGLTLYPFVNLVAKAFSSQAMIASGQVNLWPRGFNLTTFAGVMSDPYFWVTYKNTVVYTVVATAIAIAITTTFAYALSKPQLKGRGFFVGMALVTMLYSGGLIPNYLLVSYLGFRDTIWAIVLPNAINVFNLLVMKSFFDNFPRDLEEAAAIDGMSTYGIFFRIVLPLSKAVVATMVLFYAVQFWNSWFQAYLYFNDRDLYPVTLYLRNLLAAAMSTENLGTDSVQIQANVKSVAMLLTVLPIILVYPFIQKYFVRGVMLGSVKG